MIPAAALERCNRVAVCTCGETLLHYGTLKEIVYRITRRGWRYENKRWLCGACVSKEDVA